MKMKTLTLILSLMFLVTGAAGSAIAGGAEYSGQFEPRLIANTEDFERIVLKFAAADQLKGSIAFAAGAHFAAEHLIDPRTQKRTILTMLAEETGNDPVLFVDSNGDGRLSDEEKLVLKQSEATNPYLWNTTAEIQLKDGPFKTFPIFLRYFKSIRTDKMGPDDRMITQSTEAFARGRVDVKDKKVVVQYAYVLDSKKVDAQNGWLGVDSDENGDVDMNKLSPEAARAVDESVVFRVGNIYVSTKKADVGKNQIVLRENEAKDFKRAELYLDKEFPEFSFTDFEGKKRKFAEFRGKYVLLDIWGFWCPPCRVELPYLREANRRFHGRNLVVLGLNTDEDYTVDSMRSGMNKAGMNWTNAQFASVVEFLRVRLRVTSYPTTFLISPDGKILSMSRSERKDADLRGEDLLDTLDKILPKS
jgi:thiol-disulfide isomerase/thioredoxin